MTSFCIVSGVIARIQNLLKPVDVPPKNPPSWRNDVENLRTDLQYLKASLEKGKKQRNQFVGFERTIVQLCYDIDDSLAEIEMGLIPAKSGGIFSAPKIKISEKTNKSDLGSLGRKLSEIKKSLEKETGAATNTSEESTGNVPSKKHLFGFRRITSIKRASSSAEPLLEMVSKEENTNTKTTIPEMENLPQKPYTGEDLAGMEEKLSAALLKKEKLPVVCIWGKSGMGKTTFAKKVFFNRKVRQHFEVFAWVSIKQDFQTKKVLQDTLLQLLPESKAKNILAMDEFKLTQEIFRVHNCKRYLVVLEDIRTVEDWRSIRFVFPTTDESNSKILITTPLKEVADTATSEADGGAYEMKPLTEAECYNMLKEKAEFGDEGNH